MKVDALADLRAFVDECADEADEAARDAGLQKFAAASVPECLEYQFKAQLREGGLSFVHHKDYRDQKVFFCEKAWGVVLSVDVRGSTSRALEVGARGTFITMHVYMRAMIRLVQKADGLVVGLRGDGLLATFGRKRINDPKADVSTGESDKGILAAASCGDAMVRAVRQAVNPALTKRNVPGTLEVGVGIEAGPMVVTKIGLFDAHDVTAYGHCVNAAAKLGNMGTNRSKVLIGPKANGLFPSGKGGKIKVLPFGTGAFLVDFSDLGPTLS